MPPEKGRSCPKACALLRLPCSYPLIVLPVRSGSKYLFHLLQHCRSVRPGTSAAITAQSLRTPSICTASFNLASSSSVHLPARALVRSSLGSKASRHLARHCFLVRPRTSVEIANQFLPLCICTASFNSSSSSGIHLPLRAVVRTLRGSMVWYHLL
jgi:hypothetical protein